MEVVAVEKNSPLYKVVKPGYRLISINNTGIRDQIDYLYNLENEDVRLEFEDKNGDRHVFRFDYLPYPGITFKDDKIIRCTNNCIFCFVHQQPKKMRRSLYIKDDDYRLSFTHGNFVSLSCLSQSDISRIADQRLSPMYVSVHTTDNKLRRSMFRNDTLPSIVSLLKRLIKRGIVFHTQIVVCPGINDGEFLRKTIEDLYSLYPGVQTVGVVPVGLTKYRQRLSELRSVNRAKAIEILNYLHGSQKEYYKKCGSRFVFAADELYILARRELPKISEYEEMEQFENGIGMMRQMLTDFNRRKRFLKEIKGKDKKNIICLTGESAFNILNEKVAPYLKQIGFKINIYPVQNEFWGKNVTVSGLLTGRDLLMAALKDERKRSTLLLPPNCLNNDNLFLDDISLDDFRRKLGVNVITGSYSFVDTIREVFA